MKSIGISDLKKLVNDRLANPGAFHEKPLLLWDADPSHTGIAYRVIRECCIDYNNKCAVSADQVWFSVSSWTFDTDDYTSIKSLCEETGMYDFKNHGILFNTGCFIPADCQKWLDFIHTQSNDCGSISNGWPMIACVPPYSCGFTEDAFAPFDVYFLEPSILEWADWAAGRHSSDVMEVAVDYLMKKGNKVRFFYWEPLLEILEEVMENEGPNALKNMPGVFVSEIKCLERKAADDFLEYLKSL